MATLTRQNIVNTGNIPTYAAATGGGDVVDNADGKTFLHVKNASGGSITVTVTAQTVSLVTATHGTLTVPNVSVAIAAGAEKMIGPFQKAAYNTAADQLAITYSGVTSLTIGAFYINT